MYIPRGEKPSFDDEKFPGSHNTVYVIADIKGSDDKLDIYLKLPNEKKSIKWSVSNGYQYYSYGRYAFNITKNFTIPLLLIDKLEKLKTDLKGVEVSDSRVKFNYKIEDVALNNKDLKYDEYPKPVVVLKNLNDNSLKEISTLMIEPEKLITNLNSLKERQTYLDLQKMVLANECFKTFLSGKYLATLSKIEKPENSAIRYGETKTIEDEGVSKFSYIDGYIDILIFASSTQFNFMLKNVSENSIKVIWNEAVFVDFDGSTSKIMHVGTKYSQRESDQPATTIIKDAKIDDIACPTKNVRYSDVLKEWVTDPLFPKKPNLPISSIRLMLPIQVKDVVNEYIFIFEVKWVYNNPELLNL